MPLFGRLGGCLVALDAQNKENTWWDFGKWTALLGCLPSDPESESVLGAGKAREQQPQERARSRFCLHSVA